ncbi:MAG: MBL fold metallo-hydrolase [Rhodoblastus sp.]|nr:MBL fold metallo-hydrolase [Rhodoblastus sp.]MCB9998570.1 MBL fold metallo-hydrolase [Methylobacteriaceae bacterium]
MAITRRNVLAGAAVAGGLPLAQYNLCMPAFAADDDVVLGPPVKDQPIQKLSPHIYMVEAPDGFPTPENQGLMSNIVFIVGKEGVIVIDSGASLQIARMSIRQLQTVTKAPVIGVFNTHYHGDHWLGNHGFVEAYGKEIPIYAMAGTRTAIEGGTGTSWRDAMLKWTNQASSGTRIIPPSKDVDHGFTLSLGDATLRVHHYGTAHTPFDIAIEVPEDQAMCVGDILMDRRIANMEDGSYQGTLDAIDKLIANSKTAVWVPAHGDAGQKVLEWQRSLFAGIYEACTRAVKQGIPLEGALAEAMKDPRVSEKAQETKGWANNIGKYVSIAYLEAEQAQF